MNTAWEVALKAKEQGVDPQALRYIPNCNSGPYRETGFIDLNIRELGESEVEINPLYRFTHIFGELLDVNLTEMPEARELLFDVFLHYQTQLDLRSGLTKSEYYVRALLKDILNGAYGKEAADAICLFSNPQVKKILYAMLELFRCGMSVGLFQKVIRAVYPTAVVYRNTDIYRELLIYLPLTKSVEEEQKLNFIIGMFLDINFTVYTFWGKHFGIIGYDLTLQFDKMLLF